MKLNATDILQGLLLLDQLSATFVRMVTAAKEIEGADEERLKQQLKALRARNDERYTAVEARLKELAGT